MKSPRFFGRKVGSVAGLSLGLILVSSLLASPPDWWSERGATNTNPADDYAAANLGQLKQLASKAADELNAQLPGGAGTIINSLIASWYQPPTVGVTRDDYAAVNLGQLKSIAKPFYDRLMEAHYTTSAPWNALGHGPSDDYALANLGQLKQVFGFDLTSTDTAHDANQDGVPDWWASYYGITSAGGQALRGDGLTNLQAWQQGLNPNDFFHGQTPVFTIVSGNNQTGAPGGLVPAPLIVSVADSTGVPLANAPVTFTVTSGGGTLQKTNLTPPTSTLQLSADGSGQAAAYFKLPNTANTTSYLTVTIGSGSRTWSLSFTEQSDAGGKTYVDPFDPSDIQASLNPDGSAEVSWTNHTDPNDTEPINIRYRDRSGGWVTAITVPAGTTSAHVPAQ